MKTFLKVVLLLVAAVIALKLLPLTFGLACVLAVGALVLVGLGVSVVAVLLGAAIAATAALAPLWVPALVIVGIVALVRRRRPVSTVSG